MPTQTRQDGMTDTDSYPRFRWQLTLLFFCWALVSTCMMLVINVTSLTGNMLATDKSLATLPVALQWIGTAAFTIPASFLMARIGRRNGFLIAAILLIAGAGLAILAIYSAAFWLYCLASTMIGAASGFAWYYRFSAAEVVPESYRSRAISVVLAGGILAALIGPTLARNSLNMLEPYTYAGAFAVIAALQFLVILLLAFVKIPKPAALDLSGGRPLRAIARQPKFIVAVLGGVVAYSVMSSLMSATPLAMQMCSLTFDDATHVIQWHVLGMYVPAFFTGHLIKRLGSLSVMSVGGVMMAVCAAIGIAGQSLSHFWVALTLLGIGWNFLYVGATTLLTETYTVAERAKTQAANEFLVFVTVGAAVFLSGSALHEFGWQIVNVVTLPLIAAVLAAIAWLALKERHKRPAATA